jgi:hypothetical protein
MAESGFERVLQLVAEGRISAEEAGPILDALESEPRSARARDEEPGVGRTSPGPSEGPAAEPVSSQGATAIRIQVTEAGRQVVNLRVPLALGRMALDHIPGLSMSTADLVRRALAENRTGTLLAVDDKDDGVRISIE